MELRRRSGPSATGRVVVAPAGHCRQAEDHQDGQPTTPTLAPHRSLPDAELDLIGKCTAPGGSRLATGARGRGAEAVGQPAGVLHRVAGVVVVEVGVDVVAPAEPVGHALDGPEQAVGTVAALVGAVAGVGTVEAPVRPVGGLLPRDAGQQVVDARGRRRGGGGPRRPPRAATTGRAARPPTAGPWAPPSGTRRGGPRPVSTGAGAGPGWARRGRSAARAGRGGWAATTPRP